MVETNDLLFGRTVQFSPVQNALYGLINSHNTTLAQSVHPTHPLMKADNLTTHIENSVPGNTAIDDYTVYRFQPIGSHHVDHSIMHAHSSTIVQYLLFPDRAHLVPKDQLMP